MHDVTAAAEAERLSNLYSYHLIDTECDDLFTHITTMATHLFQVPIACVSLVDQEYIWVKSGQGLDFPKIDKTPGLCASTIEQDGVYRLPDTLLDPVARTNPAVTEGGVRFYAGKSLKTKEGFNIGTVCIMAMTPRDMDDNESRHLEFLANLALNEIERHRNSIELARTQEELHSSERHYHSLAELSPVGIVRADASGDCVYANSRAIEITGRPLEELKGQGYFQAIHPDDRERVQKEFNKSVDEGGLFVSEHRKVTPDGSITQVIVHVRPEVNDKGEILGYIGTLTDVTEQRELERRLQEVQRFESLAVMAGGIAHDFNNLLLGIMGNANLMQKKYSKQLSEPGHLHSIVKASQRASDLCSQLLAYAGKGRFKIESLDLNNLLVETSGLLKVNMTPDCKLELRLEDSLPLLRCDATQMQQIVMNLITNARDAIGDSPGRIELTTEMLQQCPDDLKYDFTEPDTENQPYVAVRVTDSGSGIADEQMSQIFEPFFTTKTTGHGLGMAAMLGIVRAHRGAIKIQSQIGQGTTITLIFPATIGSSTDLVSDNEIDETRLTGTVLIADDDEVAVDILVESLEYSGFEVLKAMDGEQALDLFDRYQDELTIIVLDMIMPKMDGREVYRRIRETGSEIPILFTSGYHEHDLGTLVDEADRGPVDFLQKPFLPDDLATSVLKLVPS